MATGGRAKGSVGVIPNGSVGSVYYGQSKKVTLGTTASATSIITAASATMGCVVRVISMGSGQITFGDSSITVDSGAKPGAHILQAANQGLTLNITGNIYGIISAATCVLAVTPLHCRGYGN